MIVCEKFGGSGIHVNYLTEFLYITVASPNRQKCMCYSSVCHQTPEFSIFGEVNEQDWNSSQCLFWTTKFYTKPNLSLITHAQCLTLSQFFQ